MTRKIIFFTWLLCSITLHTQAQQKPNILFIAIDDLRTQLGAYGQEQMHTPNLDKLASEARLFNHHYVQVPTCGPSRACLLTGKAVKQKSDISHGLLGQTLKGQPEKELPETFVHHLKRNGYYTVGMGKISHSDNGHLGRIGRGEKSSLELPHSWDCFVNDENCPWRGNGLLHAYVNGKHHLIKGEYRPAFEITDVEDEAYPDGRLANLATQQLEKLAKKEQPFFMAVGFYKPHLPFCAPKKYWDMYEADKIPLSPNPELPEGVNKVFLHPSAEFFQQYSHPEYGGLGKRVSDEYAKQVIHANYAATSYSDAQVGKVLNKLKELGLDKNTIIIVWGDHGWHLGDHTIWGKHSTFERALNSAFMVKTPGMKKPGIKTDGLIATIDVYPTLCELTGIKAPDGLEGKSFVPLLKNPKRKGKEAVVSYWRDILSMRTDRYRFAVFNNGEQQEFMLFDHKNDPNETVNIADENPDLVKELLKQMKSLNNGFLPTL